MTSTEHNQHEEGDTIVEFILLFTGTCPNHLGNALLEYHAPIWGEASTIVSPGDFWWYITQDTTVQALIGYISTAKLCDLVSESLVREKEETWKWFKRCCWPYFHLLYLIGNGFQRLHYSVGTMTSWSIVFTNHGGNDFVHAQPGPSIIE